MNKFLPRSRNLPEISGKSYKFLQKSRKFPQNKPKGRQLAEIAAAVRLLRKDFNTTPR